MKKFVIITIVIGLFCMMVPLTAFAGGGAEDSEKVVLTLGSWRTDDVVQMNRILDAFTKQYPNIEVQFQPTNPPDYNATLRLQLESGTGPDIMYARSYATGLDLFESGHFADLSDLEVLYTAYDDADRAPWSTADGTPFAMPFVAVSHGIYYNKEIFAAVGISTPKTWKELLAVSQAIADAGYIPFANGLADEWDIAEVVFMSLVPNYIGGREGRLAYENGKRPFNDEHIEAAFAAMKSLAPFLPQGFEAIGYNDSNALFATGKAAMYFDGSWSVGTFSDVPFEWGILAVPPPAGKQGYVTFHADAGIAINTATSHPNEAAMFLTWLGSEDAAEIVANNLPTGFFPLSNYSVTITDPHANEFLALNDTVAGTDVRLPWPRLMNGEPSGYELIMYGSIAVIKGDKTPRQAANDMHAGLAQWYKP